MGFFSELKQRRLVQILLSYAGAGWILLEAVDQMVDRGILPEIIYMVVLIWFVIGLPAALLIGWHHGEKGEQRAPMSEVAVLLILALVGVGFSGTTVRDHLVRQKLARSAENPLQVRKIAVMYFGDQTGDDNQYLADALTEDLIAELSQVSTLDVVSRNGTLQFRDQEVALDSVARALQAGTIIHGNLEKRGDKVRIIVRLTDGASGAFFRATPAIEGTQEELLSMRQEVVEETARLLRAYIGESVQVTTITSGTSNTAVWAVTQRAEKLRKDAETLVRNGDMEGAWAAFDNADELLFQAQRLEKDWALPPTQRAVIAYRKAYHLRIKQPEQVIPLTELAVEHADEALRRSRTEARAFEIRGSARYLRWLAARPEDAQIRESLLEQATKDLNDAVGFDKDLATAWATLGHLLYQSDRSQAVLAATRAYEADAYLESADLVLFRMFNGALDIPQFQTADKWCREGYRRFPKNYRFTLCQLRLLGTPYVNNPSPDSAWLLLAQQDSLTPQQFAQIEHVRGKMYVASALARAGLADSARAVLDRTRREITPQIDPTQATLVVEAYARILTGEKDRAIDLLAQVAAADPGQFSRTSDVAWWWRELETDPRFKQLLEQS